jgi:putative ABC transport system substrate-binding protein
MPRAPIAAKIRRAILRPPGDARWIEYRPPEASMNRRCELDGELGRRAILRGALSSLAAALVGTASVAAPPDKRVWRVGILRPGAAPTSLADLQHVGVPNALRELGYVEGQNLMVERRYANGQLARLPGLAQELLDARVDAITAVGSPAIRAAKQMTTTTPIVMLGNFDPVALGLVTNLAQPGGNLTGVLIAPDGTLAGKRLELLKAAIPQAVRVGLLSPPEEASFAMQVQETQKAAALLGVTITVAEVRAGNYARAFEAFAAARCTALLVGAHNYFVRDRAEIIALAAKYRLPAMYEWREQVIDGGFMSYSTSLSGLYLRIASHLDRIFNGVPPGDIPIEQPTRFDLVVNITTAKALGVVITPALRLRIDEVIE